MFSSTFAARRIGSLACSPQRLRFGNFTNTTQSAHFIFPSCIAKAFSTTPAPTDAIESYDVPPPKPKVYVVDRSAGLTPYKTSLKWMEDLVATKADKENPEDFCVLFLVQHPPVYTLGKAATLENIMFDTDPENCPFELHRLERGGEVTYHGPGQLTIYPVLNLKHFKKDLHWYVHRLEDTVSRILLKYGVVGKGDPVNPGVWVGDSKVAAIGIKVSRWMSMHGVGLNVQKRAVDGFTRIIPCGIKDKQVTAIEYMSTGSSQIDMSSVAKDVIEAFSQEFNAEMVTEFNQVSAPYLAEPYAVDHEMQTGDFEKTYAV